MSLNPVIILGMHRSGTSLVASCLEDLGLFIGNKKDTNSEAWFFLNLNNWMLRQTNASWDNPYNFQFLNATIREQIIRVTEFHLKNFFTRQKYLGLSKSLKYKSIKDLDFPWGWKDPRNTFTFEIWKDIFPEAKILHVYRHPADVIRSLQKREQIEKQETKRTNRRSFVNRVKEISTKGTVPYQLSVRAENPDEGYKLWEDYVNQAFLIEEEARNKIIHIKYENFVRYPERLLKKILLFLEMEKEPNQIGQVIKKVNPDRIFAFLKHDETIEFFQKKYARKELVEKLGYDQIS
ncbi:hypothetical protein B6I21_00475 [candidate division KSB1 bacterium 4572_119]|nr:MAG: hypothetical protein B6I21_00475 [candidate division KSB1 bacterium 4572_119]